MVKNQPKGVQNPEAKHFPSENYSLYSSKLSYKNNRRYSKKCTESKYFCLNMELVPWFKRGYMINDNENEAKNEKQVTKIRNK